MKKSRLCSGELYIKEETLRSPDIHDPVAKHEVRLVPPFEKGGLGGISECRAQEKSPPTPL